jgi:hypothetical protein
MRLTEEQIKRVEGAIRAGATKSSVIAKRANEQRVRGRNPLRRVTTSHVV